MLWGIPGANSKNQDVQAGGLQQGDLVRDGQAGEAWQAFSKLHNLNNALGGQLTEFVPEAQVQSDSMVSTGIRGVFSQLAERGEGFLVRFSDLLCEIVQLSCHFIALCAFLLRRLLLFLVSVIPDRFFGHSHFKALLESTVLASVPGDFINNTVLISVTSVNHVLLNTSAEKPLTALAGADPIVVPRGLVLADEAGFVHPRGRKWRRRARDEFLRAGALCFNRLSSVPMLPFGLGQSTEACFESLLLEHAGRRARSVEIQDLPRTH